MLTKTKTGNLIVTALMAATLGVLSQIILPVGPVPFSMATFALVFIGAMLPPAQAAASVGVYLLLGAVGLPVFAGFRGGLPILVSSTGGYLTGYVLVALAVSFTALHTRRPWLLFGAALAGLAGCYVLGTLWFMAVNNVPFGAAFGLCVAPFILPDAIKAALAISLAEIVQRRLKTGRSG